MLLMKSLLCSVNEIRTVNLTAHGVLCAPADDMEELSGFKAPAKAHSMPVNFGSPSSVTRASLLSALGSLLITSQGGSTPASHDNGSRHAAAVTNT